MKFSNRGCFSVDMFPRFPRSGRHGRARWLSVFSLMVSVLLGAATVYGIYLLLPAHMRIGGNDAPAPPPVKPAPVPPAVPEPPQRKPEPPVEPPPKPEVDMTATPAEEEPPPDDPAARERAAQATLRLAQQMEEARPELAPKWFRRVIEEHPDTDAARTAERWLREHP